MKMEWVVIDVLCCYRDVIVIGVLVTPWKPAICRPAGADKVKSGPDEDGNVRVVCLGELAIA